MLPLPLPSPTPSAAATPGEVFGLTADQWTAVGVLVALLAVLVGLAMNLRSERVTRRGQTLELEQAEATAARAEAAAALTEEYTRRVVEALEAMAAAGTTEPTVPPRRGVVWELTNFGGDTYLLRNTGDLPAEQVAVSADPSLHLVDLPAPSALAAGEALTFMAVVTMGTRDRTITVTWTQVGDPNPRQWRFPLPPRPPRQ